MTPFLGLHLLFGMSVKQFDERRGPKRSEALANLFVREFRRPLRRVRRGSACQISFGYFLSSLSGRPFPGRLTSSRNLRGGGVSGIGSGCGLGAAGGVCGGACGFLI